MIYQMQALPSLSLLSATSLLLVLAPASAASDEKEDEVKSILQRMEADALEFRDEMERVYAARCETETLTDCAEANYNDCSSTFPSQRCMEADELVISACGDGGT